MVIEPGCAVLGHDRHEHEQAPHAVDDRRNAGEKFDRRADRRAQPGRRHFGQVKGDTEADRHRDDHGDHGRDQGAEDRHQRAITVFDRIPFRREEEAPAFLGQHFAATPEHRQGGAGERDQDEECGEGKKVAEALVLQLVAAGFGLGHGAASCNRRHVGAVFGSFPGRARAIGSVAGAPGTSAIMSGRAVILKQTRWRPAAHRGSLGIETIT